ncbi:ubiquitin carboxyl-terminal hydrolase 36 isoform X2 [Uranotaenia lowii]|uniref:ubiquitin carboxyl-terminal hydrolase 36 isoform X2 n=1 Tax=Uranotaenia lowii TaxID=190385 RepID=UPI0024787141|nr:ubiquitin carboxyl-terminal hydrolase 36 isoform X2 [Uranotaenia lowii]
MAKFASRGQRTKRIRKQPQPRPSMGPKMVSVSSALAVVPVETMRVLRIVKLRLLAVYQLITRILVSWWFRWNSFLLRINQRNTPVSRRKFPPNEETWTNQNNSMIEHVDGDDFEWVNDDGTSAGAASKDQLPQPKQVLYPRESVLTGWKATGFKWNPGAGMINVGNTCYLNSTLQALFHVPAIANWLLSDKEHRERCVDSGQECIICAMAKTLIISQSGQGAIKPQLVYSKLRLVCKHLVPGRQEDAHEFLRYLVEAMEKCYLLRIPNSKGLEQYSKETTPLNQILGGYLRSEVRCMSCYHVSTTFQHFEDLLLDIRKANSIEEALDVHFARERLEEMQYKCEACKKRVAATKQFSLERAPFALCIQLKRFSMLGSKINKHVELRERLDLSPYMSQKTNRPLTYKLVSMVTHLGTTQHCGHYTAIGCTESGSYYVFDDSSVRPINIQNVTNTNAYIIFYELENVQNGIKTSASSTATSASYVPGSSSIGKIGSFNRTGPSTSGNSPITATPRSFGSSSNYSNNPHLPSKSENRPNFIGPMLPQSQNSEKAEKLVNGLNRSRNTLDIEDENKSESLMNSTRLSPVSSTTSTLSTPSPVKQTNSGNLASPSKFGKSPQNFKSKLSATSGSNNGSFKSSSTTSLVSSSAVVPSPPPILPSMPKLCNSPTAAKTASFGGEKNSLYSSQSVNNGLNGHNKTGNKTLSLVPYDPDDDYEDDEEEEEDNKIKTNGPSERLHSKAGPGSKVFAEADEDSSCSPKSPSVIKTKTGLWQVIDNRPQTSSSSSSAHSSKNNSPATSGNSSPASYSQGSGYHNQTNNNSGVRQYGNQNNTNGYNNGNQYKNNSMRNNNSNNNGGGDVVSQLQKMSHRGYGAPVRSWNGQTTVMERELANDRREERKRQAEDDQETEMDRGRTKKIKMHMNGNGNQNGMHNYFQNYQNQVNGGGGNFQNNNRNNYKWNGGSNNGGKYGNGNQNYQNRMFHNGNHRNNNHNGFRNKHHGRNGYFNKSHHHRQRDNGNGNSNGYHNR